jgi:hypothetical protein
MLGLQACCGLTHWKMARWGFASNYAAHFLVRYHGGIICLP